MALAESFFGQKFGITEQDLQKHLSEALSAGGDYADLYFEYLVTSNISIDEGIGFLSDQCQTAPHSRGSVSRAARKLAITLVGRALSRRLDVATALARETKAQQQQGGCAE